MKRQSGMQCRSAGARGTLRMFVAGKQHPLNGASVELVTNRFNGLLVQVTKPHNGYRNGEQVIVADRDFIPEEKN